MYVGFTIRRAPLPRWRSQIGPASRAQMSQCRTGMNVMFAGSGRGTPARASAASKRSCSCEPGVTSTRTRTCGWSAFAISACTAVGVSG